MDNLTHSLFGWTIARAGLGRDVPYATATLIVASNAPDIDIVAGLRSGVDYLAVHRGPTHGPLGVIGLGVVTAAIISAWARLRSRQNGVQGVATHHFVRWWLLAMVGIVCHVLMDLPTSYGTRLLSPFVWTWYALDWMPIIDVYLWLVLTVALLAGWWKRRESLAIIAVALMAGDYAARAALHERALTNGASFDAAGTHAPCAAAPTFVAHSGAIEISREVSGACLQAAALPTFFSPFTWHIVRQHPNGYELSDRSIFDTGTTVGATRFSNDSGPDVLRARTTRTGRLYFDFARFPIVQISHPAATLTTVRLLDARFVALRSGSDAASTTAPLSVVVTFDESGRIVDQRFGN
ncbi:MAG: metal-dependent hydrolase [Vicinamibacterales bacterium]